VKILRNSQLQLIVKISECPEYELIDSGSGMKFENFAGVKVIRPEPKAWWKKSLSENEWNKADAIFISDKGNWILRRNIKKVWNLKIGILNFELRMNDNSKHLGIFPEQEPHWNFIKDCRSLKNKNVLNLFGYTGASTLFALSAGASVTHVDASSPSIMWAKRNLEISGMSSKPVRWILDDAVKFVKREIRRGKRYDAIILDPPAFGRGPKGELWKLENCLAGLLADCSKLLCDNPLFIVLTIYNIEASPLMPLNIFYDVFGKNLNVESGELAIREKLTNRILPMSLWNICHFS